MTRKRTYKALSIQSWIFTGLLILFVGLIGFLSETYADFVQSDRVEAINIYGHQIMGQDRLKAMLDPYLGKSLNSLDLGELIDAFMEYPLIRSVKLTRQYPNTLNIYLRDVIPVAYINLGQVYTIDSHSRLLPLPDNGMLYNLPIITGIASPASGAVIGETLEDEVVHSLIEFLIEIRQSHPSIYLDISEISHDRKGIKIISATNSTPVLLGTEEQARDNMVILSEFIQTESDSGVISPYQYIDLRFEHQVIVKERP